MSEEKQNAHFSEFQMVRGLPCPAPPLFTRKNVEDSMDLIPNDDDIILAAYPKTGSSWLQYIILQIRSRGEVFPSFDDVTFKIVPFVELAGVEPVLVQDKPRFYKRHFPHNYIKKNDKSKYIYVYRHPEDTVVSYYHFSLSMCPEINLEFDAFFNSFITGNISYGNYFQHVLSFYEHRHDDNILMVSYETLHDNRKDEILRIAKFLGEEHYQSLLSDEELFSKIIEHTTFDYMKSCLAPTHPRMEANTETGDKPKLHFFRKGVIGDGKTSLTPVQRQQIEEAAKETLKGTSIINEWYSS